MFPLLGLTFSGLQPDRTYHVAVDFVPVDRFRYRYIYHRSQWAVNGRCVDDVPLTPSCQHPSSLTHLRQTTVTFDKLKLTNNAASCNKHVRLWLQFVAPSTWNLTQIAFNYVSLGWYCRTSVINIELLYSSYSVIRRRSESSCFHEAWKSFLQRKKLLSYTPFTRYNRLSNGLSNRFDNRTDNRLHRINGALLSVWT